MIFEILREHSDIDIDEWAAIECPLQEGVHRIEHTANKEIFDNPQWVAVAEQNGQWLAALADDEGEALDIFLARNGQEGNLEKLELQEGGLVLNLL